MKLYRPVGFQELDLILKTGSRAFPPRLAFQPIFYPVINCDYATQIARDWNTKDKNSGFVGYVTTFEVDDNYISQFSIQQVGGKKHKEYWIPAEVLDEFNSHINGNIIVIKAYYGDKYQGKTEINSFLKDKNYEEQLKALNYLKKTNLTDYTCVVLEHWEIITQNYFLWKAEEDLTEIINSEEKKALLDSIEQVLRKHNKWFIKLD